MDHISHSRNNLCQKPLHSSGLSRGIHSLTSFKMIEEDYLWDTFVSYTWKKEHQNEPPERFIWHWDLEAYCLGIIAYGCCKCLTTGLSAGCGTQEPCMYILIPWKYCKIYCRVGSTDKIKQKLGVQVVKWKTAKRMFSLWFISWASLNVPMYFNRNAMSEFSNVPTTGSINILFILISHLWRVDQHLLRISVCISVCLPLEIFSFSPTALSLFLWWTGTKSLYFSYKSRSMDRSKRHICER